MYMTRLEMTHEVVVEAGTQEALQGMLNELEPDDRKETEMITRALAALEPDGWRGVDHGLRDEVRCAQWFWLNRPGSTT